MAAMTTVGTTFAFPLGACELADFSSTQTVTLNTEEVVTYLIRTALITPLDNLITEGVEKFFDQFEDEDA
jgi:hypothetical protein